VPHVESLTVDRAQGTTTLQFSNKILPGTKSTGTFLSPFRIRIFRNLSPKERKSIQYSTVNTVNERIIRSVEDHLPEAPMR